MLPVWDVRNGRHILEEGKAMTTTVNKAEDPMNVWPTIQKAIDRSKPCTCERHGTPQTYRVTWVIDIDAVSPEHAARQALDIQRDKESTATVFDVREPSGNNVTIDTLADGNAGCDKCGMADRVLGSNLCTACQ
jgi:hypothetical protein